MTAEEKPPLTLRRWLPWLVVAIVAAVLVTLWLRIPWAWSPVDDAGHVLELRKAINAHGLVGGIASRVTDLVHVDMSWGLFRPAYWVYPATFYFLTPTMAHLTRLGMLAVAVAGPLVHFYRSGVRGPRLTFMAVILVGAASSLYIGLFLVSLQELTGMSLIGVGLMVRNRWARWVAWTLAAWFKAPFAWLLMGEAIVNWRQGRRRIAVANAVTALLTLLLAIYMARHGSYTSQYSLTVSAIWSNGQHLLEPTNLLLIASLVWWLVVTGGRLRCNADTLVFGVGCGGYAVQLLPWSLSAYYPGPVSFLLGLTLCSIIGPVRIKGWPSVAALALPVIIAVYLVVPPLRQGFAINGAMRTLQDCLAFRSGSVGTLSGSVPYVSSSPEGPIRLVQNLKLDDPNWAGDFSLDSGNQSQLPAASTLLLNAGPPPSKLSSGIKFLCGTSWAQVFGS